MDKEDVVYIYIYTHTHTQWNTTQPSKKLAICHNVYGTRGYYAKQDKSFRERQLSYDLIHMWNLRNKAEDHRGKEEKMKQDKTREGDKW